MGDGRSVSPRNESRKRLSEAPKAEKVENKRKKAATTMMSAPNASADLGKRTFLFFRRCSAAVKSWEMKTSARKSTTSGCENGETSRIVTNNSCILMDLSLLVRKNK